MRAWTWTRSWLSDNPHRVTGGPLRLAAGLLAVRGAWSAGPVRNGGIPGTAPAKPGLPGAGPARGWKDWVT